MVYSIIVPVYNRRKYIRRCLDSIMKQSFQDFELIIVDDGSDDGTAEICDEYGQKYGNIKVHHQQNGGASKARNTGLKLAEGTFALFVDSDDYLPLDYLYQLMLAYEKYGFDFWYYTPFKIYTISNIQYFRYRKGVNISIVNGSGLIELMNKGLFNSVVNKVYEMSLVKKYGIHFPEDISLGEDLIFNLCYLDKKSEFKFLVLNKNYYIVWGKDTKDSLERGWREDFFDIKRKLLREKVKYINKWSKEEKISIDRESTIKCWYFYCMKDSIKYYILHVKDMGGMQLIKKMNEIKHSQEYFRYRRMCRGKKWILAHMVYSILYTELKETNKINRGERKWITIWKQSGKQRVKM